MQSPTVSDQKPEVCHLPPQEIEHLEMSATMVVGWKSSFRENLATVKKAIKKTIFIIF